MHIRDVQQQVWKNKVTKGFNTTDTAFEFGLLVGEVGEAFTAWHKKLPDFGEELADIVLFAVSVAQIEGIDLQSEVELKLAKNARRTYERNENGVLIRTGEG